MAFRCCVCHARDVGWCSGGDLTATLLVDSRDEVGQTKDAFNRFLASLHDMVSEVKGNSARLLDGIESVGKANRQYQHEFGATGECRHVDSSLPSRK